MRRLGLFFILAAAGASAATLSVGNYTGTAGQTLQTIGGQPFGVSLAGQGASVAGVQVDVLYDKTNLTITATTGQAASDAGKSVSTSQLPNNAGLRILVVGFNQDTIADGLVANLKIVINANAPSSNYTLTLSNASGTDPNGTTLPVSVSSGNLAVGNPPALSVSKTHNGSFSQGQASAQYTVTVSNQAGAASTTGKVTMTETVPTGLTLVSMAGNNWDCSGVTTCVRSDALAGGASYDPITVTTSVANNAPGSLTNQVSVTGGGSLAASAMDVTTIVIPQPQTITFNALSGVTFGSPSFTIGATASSGLTVTFLSTTQAVCMVSGNSVSLVAAGTCTIAANQPGNGTFAPAPTVMQSFTVSPGPQTITFNQPADTALNAGPVTLSASSNSSLTVSFASNTMSICTVSGTSVGLLAQGTCSITATQAGNANYNAATPVTKTFTVLGNSNVITFTQPSDTELFAGPVTLSASANSGLTVTFTSNSSAVCTVNMNSVSLVSVGVCSITANQAGNASFAAAAPVTKTFNVLKGSQTITFNALGNVPFGTANFNISASASSNLTVTFASNSAGICTVSGNTVAIAGAGICSITASQAGNANYAAAPPVTQTFSVTQASQTITFNALSNVAFGSGQVTLSASSNSNLTVSFASTTQGVCTVSGNAVSLVSVGTCSITASQAGNANYTAATPVIQSFTITQGSQTITFNPLNSVAVGVQPFTVSATSNSGLTVTFASSTTSVCTVNIATVSILTTGTCSIVASQTGNANYTAATPVTQSFTVAAASQTITFTQPGNVTFGAANFTLSASSDSHLTVTFTSTTPLVCTVSGSTVTIAGAGTCTINADQAGNANFGAAPTVTRSFTVAQASQTITFGVLSNTPFSGNTISLSATAGSSLAVTFTSTTTSVCSVSGSTLTLVSVGSCSIAADQAGNANYTAAPTVTRTFTITPGSQTITFGTLSNVAFGSPAFPISATASSGLPVSFASTTTAICTVATTVSGTTVTLVAPGSCSITASQAGNANYTAATPVTQTFSVAAGSQTITFNPLNNVAFSSATFTVSATASSNLPVSFSSTTTPVCTVSGSPVAGFTVTLVSVGTCTIQATQAGNANFAAATPVPQSFTVTQGSQTITFNALSSIALGLNPPALGATASSGLTVAYASTTQAVCTVSGTTITLVDIGTCTIVASQAGNANYTAASPVTQSFTVTPGAQTITFPTPADVTFGTATFTLTASTTSNLTLTFTSNSTSVCTVSGASVTLAGAGTCSITASQPGSASFSAAVPVTRTFTVTKAAQTITFTAPSDVILGVTPFTISATSDSKLTVAFASTTQLVCTISGNTVTVIAAGVCTVSATQAGDTNYLAATLVSRSFNVARGPQTITFGPLPTVAFGVPNITLSATSSSNLTVTFASTTVAVCTVNGTTLSVVAPGNCSVTASQAGDTNYTAAMPVTQSFIATGTQSITFPSISTQALGTPPFQLGATSTAGLPVSYASTTTAVCTVSGNTLTLVAVGTCSITASQAGNSIFLAAGPSMNSFNVIAAPPCQYSLSPGDTSIPAAGGQGVFDLQTGSGCAWTATSNASFITVTSSGSGTDPTTVSYSVASNSGSARSGTLTVGGQTFTVNQFGTSCSFAVTPPSLDFTAAGGSGTVSVFAPIANCAWTGTPGDPAVTLSPMNGTAPSQVTVTLAANSATASRTVNATIGGQTLTLNQSGVNCTVTLGAMSATIPAAGGPGSVDITTQNGCTYSTVSGPSWINIVSGGRGSGPGGTLFYSVDANSTTTARSGAMNIGGQSFQITQPGVSCEISIDTSTLGSPFASGGGTGTIGVLTSNPACNWTASTGATWLSFNGPTAGTGAGSVSVTASANAALSSRSASVTIEGQLVSVSQAGTVCTFALRASTGAAPAAGGSGSAGVVSAPGCTWTSTANDSWLHITSSANSGTGDVQFTADANATAAARSGTLTVAGQTYTVNQAGANCTFSLALAGVNIPQAGITNGTVGFTTTTTGCTASARSFSGWLTVSTALSGLSGTVTFNATANNGPARTGFVKLGDQTFSVNEAAATCSYMLASAGTILSKAGGMGSIQITASGPGCSPTISSNQSWAVPGSLSGPVSNVYTLPFTISPFVSASNAVRTAKITLSGKTYTIKQTSW